MRTEEGRRRRKNAPDDLATAFVVALQMPARAGDQGDHVLNLDGEDFDGHLLGREGEEEVHEAPGMEQTHSDPVSFFLSFVLSLLPRERSTNLCVAENTRGF